MAREFDFIIVGAGTAGCLLAFELSTSQPQAQVLLLESGPDTGSTFFTPSSRLFEQKYTEFDYGYKTTSQRHLKNRELSYAQGKGLGGSTTINRLFWTTGSQDDYNHYAELIGDDAWRWDNVKAIYKKFVKLNDNVIEGRKESIPVPRAKPEGWEGQIDVSLPPQWIPEAIRLKESLTSFGIPWNSDTNSGNPIGLSEVWNSYGKETRTTSYSALLQNKTPHNLTILAESKVARILFNDRKATGVELQDGIEIFVTKEVILSCGAFHTPQLLMVSGIGPEEVLRNLDITPKLDLQGVGQNLGDHSRVQLIAIIDKTETTAQGIQPGFDNTLIAWLKLPKVFDSAEYKSLDPAIQKFIALSKVPTCEVLFSTIPHPGDTTKMVLSIVAINMNPQATGTVSISSSSMTDPPMIDPNLVGHAYDKRVLTEAIKEMLQFLERGKEDSFVKMIYRAPKGSTDEDINEFLCEQAEVVWHANGTVKMGHKSDPMACVDSDFKVFGIDGLRVVDLSICPFTPNAHTQSTGYVIGAIAASKLGKEYGFN
ncbi:glucose-methanol-choline oxidoreductase [Xylogone sp. PMI_703]|nr:glucose-methanol-choline oxidoreductase [Xylogone sp. PMI_703]